MIWNGGTFSWNWKVPSLNCDCAPLWMKLTGKLPVMVIPAAPMLDHYHPWSKHTLRKLAFDCVCETGIRCNSSFMIQCFIYLYISELDTFTSFEYFWLRPLIKAYMDELYSITIKRPAILCSFCLWSIRIKIFVIRNKIWTCAVQKSTTRILSTQKQIGE